jgi:hypothetical protein
MIYVITKLLQIVKRILYEYMPRLEARGFQMWEM